MFKFPENAADMHQINLSRLKGCIKRPVTVRAVKMDASFKVSIGDGLYHSGKPGDYLMCGVNNELYVCPGDVFEKTYDWVK